MPATLLLIVQHWNHPYIWSQYHADATKWCCSYQTASPCLGPPPSVTFSQLSSKCHWVCYKSSKSSLCLRVVAFLCWKHFSQVEVCRPPPLPPLKISLWVLPDSLWAPSPSPTHELHPSVNPSAWHPSISWPSVTLQDWNPPSELLEETMVMRKGLRSLC